MDDLSHGVGVHVFVCCIEEFFSLCHLHRVDVESKAQVSQIKIRHVAGYPIPTLL